MTPEEEQLKIASGELFENLHSSTIVQSKNGGSKRGREVVNDECDFKNSKKQKSKSKMKKAIRNLQDRVGVVEGQLTSIKLDIDELKGMMSTILKHIGLQKRLGITLLIVLTLVVSYLGDEGDCKGFEGLVDHTLESEEVDNAKTEDVDTGGTPNWLRMPKEDDTSNGAKHIELKKKGDEDVHTIGTPPWLRFNIELEKPINVLEKKVEIGLEEPIDVVDDERILVAKWPQYKECIKENCPFDWKEEYKLVDYVVGSKKDFQDPWASVDYVYSPFNVHKPLGSIMLGFGKLSSQGMGFASVTYKCRRDEKHVIADLRVGAKFVR
ncbi:Ulp1-like peptidase [Cucumis melo var. makuwa]|uniref:Ulp1-like peptidase n=1 Tax=Cucumis melo var. makuwa TaxID=1194695 RepID=A0A5A7U0K7_CUCMM|nr:Ulp1-like peptidase [Cucumis melo var. makuwa]TYK02402.1 Ulp1-like peptidase [Cucumis melo var. makuwa]